MAQLLTDLLVPLKVSKQMAFRGSGVPMTHDASYAGLLIEQKNFLMPMGTMGLSRCFFVITKSLSLQRKDKDYEPLSYKSMES
jgi:hypothetical protein